MDKGEVLLTRPLEDAEATAKALALRGIASVVAPLLEIVPRDETPSLRGVQAVLATSANGIRAFARHSQRRDVRVLAVGHASAQAARDNGFVAVESAAGDVGDLAALVRRRLRAQDGPLLHPAGTAIAGDLAALLVKDGFKVRRYAAYSARPVRELPQIARQMLIDGGISAVLLYSPRTATIFRDLIEDAGFGNYCSHINALCLSTAVARALEPLAFLDIRIAEQPDQDALFALLSDATEQSG